MTRARCALLLAALGLAACGGEPDAATARIERCAERLVAAGSGAGARAGEQAQRYARTTYCAPFERRGWVYDDGALAIAAHEWLESSGSQECVTAAPGVPARTVPCPEREPRLHCALLRHVRRSEVERFLAEVRERREPACDDGTALGELGVP